MYSSADLRGPMDRNKKSPFGLCMQLEKMKTTCCLLLVIWSAVNQIAFVYFLQLLWYKKTLNSAHHTSHQNMPFRDQNVKNFPGRGSIKAHCALLRLLPLRSRTAPSPHPHARRHDSGAFGARHMAAKSQPWPSAIPGCVYMRFGV